MQNYIWTPTVFQALRNCDSLKKYFEKQFIKDAYYTYANFSETKAQKNKSGLLIQ